MRTNFFCIEYGYLLCIVSVFVGINHDSTLFQHVNAIHILWGRHTGTKMAWHEVILVYLWKFNGTTESGKVYE